MKLAEHKDTKSQSLRGGESCSGICFSLWQFFVSLCLCVPLGIYAQSQKIGDFIESTSYNLDKIGVERHQQYWPLDDGFVCENGTNRFTRALYGGWTDYRIETSDRPVFAIVKKNYHRHLRFLVNGVPLDSTDYCRANYVNGMRVYSLRDRRWGNHAELALQVVALPDREGAVWLFDDRQFVKRFGSDNGLSPAIFRAELCAIANPKLHRNGDIGADKPGVFEASPKRENLVTREWKGGHETYFVIDSINQVTEVTEEEGRALFLKAVLHNGQLAARLQFQTPDPYINTLGSALVFAADGDWDGQTWLHGCIGWRMPLAGWRAGYLGDVLGWNNRAVSHFDAYAKSQVTNVEPVVPHPSQDPKMNLARAEKKWGTQMYSNGYICRNPERNDQMHHYDMNLNYIDELLWHFQYDADTTYMRKMWPVIKLHLAWEKRNYDPDGDHLYDAYCCIWASDALYYSGGAVTHSSAYNYRGNKLAARIAAIIGEDAEPYRKEADAILKAMDERLWLPKNGVWAEYQDAMGLKRTHDHPAVWSIYTPIDCGACTPRQAFFATRYIDDHIPHIDVENTGLYTISTSDWLPYSWSINNVAAAEVMHTALAYFEAGRSEEAYRLMKANILDQMYYGASPGNFGQISYYDAARGECYRDFGDCIGISSRTLLQGLFGIIPQALDGKCIVRPGFPMEWDSASVKTPYLAYKFTRKNDVCRYEITQNFRQPLKIVFRQNLGNGQYRDIEGTAEAHQVIEVSQRDGSFVTLPMSQMSQKNRPSVILGLEEPDVTNAFRMEKIERFFNAEVDDIYKNKYLSPRPLTTTLQIPTQGIGEWCHPQLTAEINDSVFRTLIKNGVFDVAGVPFRTPAEGWNVIYTSLWDNYPDTVVIPLKGKAGSAYLLMAGSTNHMQSRIDNGLVIVTYQDGSKDTLALRNPDNWCPIEQDYYVDGKAFQTADSRPYRVCLGTGDVSRDLGKSLGIQGVYGREIPGGAAQMLRMRLNPQKKLKSLTVRTLSNDVVIGLMALTLQ